MKLVLKGLNYLIALFLICLAIFLAYIAIPAFGNKALIVRSGSMEPTIKTGDLIVVRIASGITSPLPNVISKYKVGDTIAFGGDKNPNVLTTHKIVAKKIVSGKTLYQTQGDANKTADTKLIAEEQIVGKSIFTLPKVGKLFAYAKTKQGFALLVLIPALLVILIESTNLIKELFKINRARRMLQADPKSEMENGNLLGPVGLRVLMPIVISIMFFHNSYAFFSDSASSLNNTFTAASVFPTPTPTPTPSPTPTPGAGDVVINELMWMGSQGNSADEWVELRNMTGSVIDISGWTLTDVGPGVNDITIPTGKTIPANGFFIISNDTEAGSVMSVTPDYVVNLSMNNNGEQLILMNSAAVTIDTADNNGSDWFAGLNSTPKKSMERKSPPGDGTISSNWHTATTTVNLDVGATESATPKTTND